MCDRKDFAVCVKGLNFPSEDKWAFVPKINIYYFPV